MKKIITSIAISSCLNAQVPAELPSESVNNGVIAKVRNHSYEGAKKKAYEAIESYRQRVINGESMSVLAALYSEDPGSSQHGGQYDGVIKGMMVAEFEEAAFNLKLPGDLSEVFETKFGFHFIQLISRDADKVNIRHILVTPK